MTHWFCNKQAIGRNNQFLRPLTEKQNQSHLEKYVKLNLHAYAACFEAAHVQYAGKMNMVFCLH